MPRVLIVDDEALIRSGFELILSAVEDIDVVATCDGVQAVDVIARLRPDVVLLDIRMPGKDGLSVLAELRAMPDPPTVAVLTTFDADEYIASALRLGASGFLLKDTDPEQLPHMVRTLVARGLVLSDKVSPRVVDGYLDGHRSDRASSRVSELSERETQVLRELARGSSNAEIAAALFSSVGTVKDQVSSVFHKLGVTTRVEAALIAQRAGLLDDAK